MTSVLFSRTLYPCRALDRSARVRLCWLTASLPLFVALVLMLFFEAWLLLPFAGLEALIILWAYKLFSDADHDYQSIEVNGHSIAINTASGGSVCSETALVAWCKLKWAGDSLHLHAHGRDTEIGALLPYTARLKLAADLRSALQTAAPSATQIT